MLLVRHTHGPLSGQEQHQNLAQSIFYGYIHDNIIIIIIIVHSKYYGIYLRIFYSSILRYLTWKTMQDILRRLFFVHQQRALVAEVIFNNIRVRGHDF